jgi:fibrillarin-like rRNA methylase
MFDVKWIPLLKKHWSQICSILSLKIEKHIKTIYLLSQNTTSFIHVSDYDQEGESNRVQYSRVCLQ